MNQDIKSQLLQQQNECTLIWNTTDGGSTGTIVNYLWHEDKMWVTARYGTHRIKAIERNKNVTAVVSGKGTPLGIGRCITLRGTCIIHNDPKTREWFFPLFAKNVLRDSEKGAKTMSGMLNTPESLVLEISIAKDICHDSHTMLMNANAM